MEIIEIFDPELAMCLQERGFPYLYTYKEERLEIIAFEVTPEFDVAFDQLDMDEGTSIVRVFEIGNDRRAATDLP